MQKKQREQHEFLKRWTRQIIIQGSAFIYRRFVFRDVLFYRWHSFYDTPTVPFLILLKERYSISSNEISPVIIGVSVLSSSRILLLLNRQIAAKEIMQSSVSFYIKFVYVFPEEKSDIFVTQIRKKSYIFHRNRRKKNYFNSNIS